MLLTFISLVVFLAPPQTSTLLQKGLLELQHGELKPAREDLEAASKIDPQNAYVWSALAEVYAESRDLALASTAAAQAEKLGAGNPVVQHALALYYSHIGEFVKAALAEERYAQSAKADHGANARAAEWYLAAGDSAKALPLAKVAAEVDAEAGFELAQNFLRQQQFTDAAELLQSGLKSRPDDPDLTLALGVARYGQRRFDDAITNFLRAIELDKQAEQPYLFLGRMLDQAGPHLDEITKDAEDWAQQNSTNAQAELLLAKILRIRDPKAARAETLLRRSIELDGTNWESHFELGVLLEANRQFAPAVEELRRATELDSKQPMPHYHLARVYDRLGDATAAASQRDLHRQLINAVH